MRFLYLQDWYSDGSSTSRRRRHLPCRRKTRQLAIESLETRALMSATPGTLDPAFGPGAPTAGSGYVTTAFPIPYSQLGVKSGLQIMTNPGPTVNAMAVLPSAVTYKGVTYPAGSIIAAGTQAYAPTSNPNYQEDSSFLLAIYNPDGSLNSSFGSSGKVTTTFFPIPSQGAEAFDGSEATSVLLQNVGGSTKIVVVGNVLTTVWSKRSFSQVGYIAVARYNLDGTLDTTFNGTGKETFNSSTWKVGWGDAGFQSSGDLVVSAGQELGPGDISGVARFLPNGGVDTHFGTGGIAYTTSFFPNGEPLPMVVQPDDKIVVASWTHPTPSTYAAAVARLNANGTVDTTFGTNGLVTLAIPNLNSGQAAVDALSLQTVTDNLAVNHVMIVAAGSNYLARFDSGITPTGASDGVAPGTLDTSFGTNGLTTFTLMGSPSPTSLVLAPSGDIMLGESGALMAFTANGAPDTSFGTGGIVAASQFPFTGAGITSYGGYPGLQALAIEADGNILAGGEVNGLFGAASYSAPPLTATLMAASGKLVAATSPAPTSSGGISTAALDQVFAGFGDDGPFDVAAGARLLRLVKFL